MPDSHAAYATSGFEDVAYFTLYRFNTRKTSGEPAGRPVAPASESDDDQVVFVPEGHGWLKAHNPQVDLADRSATTKPNNPHQFEYLRHTTISRDSTHTSRSEREKLVVLQEGVGSGAQNPSAGSLDHLFQSYSNYTEPKREGSAISLPPYRSDLEPQLTFPQRPGRHESVTAADNAARSEKKQVLKQKQPGLRVVRRLDTVQEGLSIMPEDSGRAPSAIPKTASSESRDVGIGTFLTSEKKGQRRAKKQKSELGVDDIDRQIFELQRLRDSLTSTTIQVFHIIDKKHTRYLAAPSWRVSHDDERAATLVGHSPLADESRFLKKRSDIAFAVYKKYISKHQSRAVKEVKAMGAILPDPVPVRETIRLVSDQMREAMVEFQNAHPAFEADFPHWRPEMPMPSPFLFWYRCRQSLNIKEMANHHQQQIRLLTDWIEHHYQGVYAEAEEKFRHGKVSSSAMSFLVRPGDVLVKRDPKGLIAYVAESWPKLDNGDSDSNSNSDSGSDSDSDSDSDLEETLVPKRKAGGKASERWQVRAWTYNYDGRFSRSSTDLYIDLEFDEEDPDVDLNDLNVLPLRFAHPDVRDQLARRGRTMWACRHRKFVTYNSSLENDPLGDNERYMIDFKTYKELHPDAKVAGSLAKSQDRVIDDEVMDSDEPPQEPDLLVLPNTLVGYNFRQKKWSEYTTNLPLSKA